MYIKEYQQAVFLTCRQVVNSIGLLFMRKAAMEAGIALTMRDSSR